MQKRAAALLEQMQTLQNALRSEKRANRDTIGRWFHWARHAVYDTYPEYFGGGDFALTTDEKPLERLDEIEADFADGKPEDLVKRCRDYVTRYQLVKEVADLRVEFCSLLDDRLSFYISNVGVLYKLSIRHDELTRMNAGLEEAGMERVEDPYLRDTEMQMRTMEQGYSTLNELFKGYRKEFPEGDEAPGGKAIQRMQKLLRKASQKLF